MTKEVKEIKGQLTKAADCENVVEEACSQMLTSDDVGNSTKLVESTERLVLDTDSLEGFGYVVKDNFTVDGVVPGVGAVSRDIYPKGEITVSPMNSIASFVANKVYWYGAIAASSNYGNELAITVSYSNAYRRIVENIVLKEVAKTADQIVRNSDCPEDAACLFWAMGKRASLTNDMSLSFFFCLSFPENVNIKLAREAIICSVNASLTQHTDSATGESSEENAECYEICVHDDLVDYNSIFGLLERVEDLTGDYACVEPSTFGELMWGTNGLAWDHRTAEFNINKL